MKLYLVLPEGKEPMKPLDDWLAKLQKKGPIQVAFKVDPKAGQDSMITALNLLAARDITEITFAVIPKEDD